MQNKNLEGVYRTSIKGVTQSYYIFQRVKGLLALCEGNLGRWEEAGFVHLISMLGGRGIDQVPMEERMSYTKETGTFLNLGEGSLLTLTPWAQVRHSKTT